MTSFNDILRACQRLSRSFERLNRTESFLCFRRSRLRRHLRKTFRRTRWTEDEQVARAMTILSEHYGAAVVIVPAMDDDGAQGFEVMSTGDKVMSLGLASAFRGSA